MIGRARRCGRLIFRALDGFVTRLMRQLRLESLFKEMPPLTPACTQIRGEAGIVCLESQNHGARSKLTVSGTFNEVFVLTRPAITDAMRRSHNDDFKAAEH